MQYRIDYFGFVYLWFDTKRKRYIIGSHFGSADDGYTTSTGGKLVRRIFKARPNTMKRRIIEYITVDSLQSLREAEERWLSLRPHIGLNKRYYNCKNKSIGIDSITASHLNNERVRAGTHNFQNKEAASIKAKNRVAAGTHHFINSDFNKKPFELYKNGELIGRYESKEHAVQLGIPAHLIDKLRKFSTYTTERNSYKKQLFKTGDIFEYKNCA